MDELAGVFEVDTRIVYARQEALAAREAELVSAMAALNKELDALHEEQRALESALAVVAAIRISSGGALAPPAPTEAPPTTADAADPGASEYRGGWGRTRELVFAVIGGLPPGEALGARDLTARLARDHDFQASTDAVRRACGRLAEKGLILRTPQGSFGPAGGDLDG